MAAGPRTGPPTTYKITKKLGDGAFGTVSLCCDDDTGEELAVKTLKISGGEITDKQRLELALEKEIKLLTSCQHERIVRYYGCDNSPTHGFLIFLEYMAGGSVADQIKRDGPLTESLTLKYTQQILEGLAYLQSKGVIHRDVKGGNVLCDTNENVKLADFGLSKQMREITGSMGMSVVGTLRYMAPEVFKGRYDFKIDIWGVGCIVVEMLTGKPPNEGLRDFTDFGSYPQAKYTLPALTTEKTRAMLDRTFRPSAEERPSASELLEQFFENTVTETRAPTELNFPGKECRLILLGKTGNGKSRTGNTLLGNETFKVEPFSMASVTAETAGATITNMVFGVQLKIIDTPGLFDTSMSQDETMSEICKCAELSSPGPHAILFVVRLDTRFTEEEEKALSMLSEQFGENIINFVIVVFTHGDIMGPDACVDKIIDRSPDSLKKCLKDVKNRYVVFNNTKTIGSQESMDQVKRLLIAVRDMLKDTGETHFSSNIFVLTERRLMVIRNRIADCVGVNVENHIVGELTTMCIQEVEKNLKAFEQKLKATVKKEEQRKKKEQAERSKLENKKKIQNDKEQECSKKLILLRKQQDNLRKHKQSKGKQREIDQLGTKIHKKEEEQKKCQQEIEKLESLMGTMGMGDSEEELDTFLKEITAKMKASHAATKNEFRQEIVRRKVAAFLSDDKDKCCIQ